MYTERNKKMNYTLEANEAVLYEGYVTSKDFWEGYSNCEISTSCVLLPDANTKPAALKA